MRLLITAVQSPVLQLTLLQLPVLQLKLIQVPQRQVPEGRGLLYRGLLGCPADDPGLQPEEFDSREGYGASFGAEPDVEEEPLGAGEC